MMKTVLKWLLIAGAATLFLTRCGEEVQPQVEPGEVFEIPAFDWHVVSQEELERVYQNSGMHLAKWQTLHGFVGVTEEGDVVVFTLPPKRVDDQITLTLGHEVLHLALGEYHK